MNNYLTEIRQCTSAAKAGLRFLLALALSSGTMAAFAQPYRANLDIRIPSLADQVIINGKQVAYYELFATNFGTDTIRLKDLKISDNTGRILAVFDNDALKKRSAKIGTQGKIYTDTLAPGRACVVYIEMVSPQRWHNAIQLLHRLVFETLGRPLHTLDSLTLTSLLPRELPLILGPPLGKGNWAAVYEPSWPTGHRRVIYTIDGKARIPGRYAIDFIKLNNEGRLSKGKDDLVRAWYGYGAAVLAVADGTIASARDNFMETQTVSGRERVTAERATGNYISIKLGNGKYAFYEHLKPGSIRVLPGQRVKKGQVIAAIGFTGQSDGPHLHFHVADKNSPLGAEGIPFAFDQFTWLGNYTAIDSLGRAPWLTLNPLVKRLRCKERPGPNSVICFTQAPHVK